MHSQTARWVLLHVDKTNWKGAGVVDRGGLENRCTLAGTQGSNPCLSAKKAAEFQRLSCIKIGREPWKSSSAHSEKLCLSEPFAEPEDEKFSVFYAMEFTSECLDIGVDLFCGCVG